MILDMSDAEWVQNNVWIQWVHANPTFAYTIGLWKHDLPELIVVGVGQQHTMAMLNLIAARMHRYGAFKVGDIDTDLFTAPTKFGAVSRLHVRDKLTRALDAAYPNGLPPLLDLMTPVLQVLWPDRRGIFPDEKGFSSEFKYQQVLA